jgi:hypothetical protein
MIEKIQEIIKQEHKAHQVHKVLKEFKVRLEQQEHKALLVLVR